MSRRLPFSVLRPRSSGFTLIELLVAASITVIMAALMLTVVVNALNSWSRSHGTLEAEAQARLVLDQLTADLQGAMFRSDGNTWLAATVQTDTGISGQWTGGTKTSLVSYDPTTVQFPDCHFGLAGMWLRFITSRPANTADIAAPVAVAYQIIRRLPPGASATAQPHYLLYRSEVTAANTFATGYNLNPDTGVYTASSATDGNAGNIINPPPLRFIADNVVDFGARFYSRNTTTGALTLLFPATPTDVKLLSSSAASRFPDVVDVMIRVLTADGVKTLTAFEASPASFPGQDWWTIVIANSKVFTRRIVMNAPPL